MNGIAQAILAATPLAALVLYFALSGQQQVATEQQRQLIRQEIDSAKFDLEFDQALRSIDGEVLTQQEKEAREQAIQALEEKAEDWEKQFEQGFKELDSEMHELKSAMENMK